MAPVYRYGTTTSTKLYEDDSEDRYFHIYYNPSKQAAEREQLEQRIDKLKQFMDKHIGKTNYNKSTPSKGLREEIGEI